MNTHIGHRDRLRNRFLNEGLNNFEPHEVLELLLYQVIPYKDTNVLAHKLIDKFGSLSNVLSAPYNELKTTEGLSEISAANLALIYPLFNYFKSDRAKGQKLSTVSDIYSYVLYVLSDNLYEQALVICIDNSGKVIGQKVFCDNDVSKVIISPKDIASVAMGFCSNSVIIAHSHPNGTVNASVKDDEFTKLTYTVLKGMGINLLEHIIVSGTQYYSYCAERKIDEFYKQYINEYKVTILQQEETKIING